MATFAAVGVSSTVNLRPGQRLAVAVTGTFVALLQLQRKAGAAWRVVREFRAAFDTLIDDVEGGDYRLQCYAYTSGTVTYTIAAQTPSAARTLASNYPMGDAFGKAAIGFGQQDGAGLQVKIIDEVVDLTAAGAKFKAMTTAVPSGAVILSVSANVEVLAVAGGTSVKVGLGPHGSATNKYGNSSALTKNLKIDTIPDWAVLGADEPVDVNAVTTAATALGDSNFTAGKVRVRIVYLQAVSLIDAP